MTQVAKRFRLLRRNDDGSAVHESNDADGYTLLTVAKDGSRYMHSVEGVCGDCMAGRHARADCPWRDPAQPLVAEPEPAWQQGVGDSLGETLKAQPPPYVPPPYVPEPEPEPEPVKLKERRPARRAPEPPADPLLDASARSIAKRVWAMGSMWPSQIFPRGLTKSACDEVLVYAQVQGWIIVEPSSQVVKGAVHPEPLLSYRIPNDATPRYLG